MMIFGSTVNDNESSTEKNDDHEINTVNPDYAKMRIRQYCLECSEPISAEHQLQYSGTHFCVNCEEKIEIKRFFLSSYKRRFNRNHNNS
ncbi:hypothetical protein [Snodgrassella communis]|uniref:hypothetical protein n=1 Tax=Snodgrassella communis TaxID=2946699 RepID=UPI001EF64BBA|nr:hypothetical protein [Snodgrassella communis]